MNVNILEGLRFYVSFACTFSFAESKNMEGSAKIVSLVARDEATHLNLSTHVLKNWIKGLDDKDFKKIAAECEDEVLDMWRTCVDEEKAWANYLFKDGAIIGLNEELLHHYVEFIQQEIKGSGYKTIYDLIITVLDTTLAFQVSGLKLSQETEVESYIGGINKMWTRTYLKALK